MRHHIYRNQRLPLRVCGKQHENAGAMRAHCAHFETDQGPTHSTQLQPSRPRTGESAHNKSLLCCLASPGERSRSSSLLARQGVAQGARPKTARERPTARPALHAAKRSSAREAKRGACTVRPRTRQPGAQDFFASVGVARQRQARPPRIGPRRPVARACPGRAQRAPNKRPGLFQKCD